MHCSPIHRFAILSVVALFLGGALGPALAAPSPEGGSSGRASDLEPNDSMATAVALAPDEVVEGSIMLNPTNDYMDYYKISVPYGKVLNASLYMVDYDPADPGKYD